MGRIILLAAVILVLSAGSAFAPLVTVVDDDYSSSSSSSDDTSVVDLSDRDTDAPTWSPSFDNTTPAGMAPGGPIED